MDKIIQVVNSMISNSDKINNVIVNQRDELFFIYNNKYKWSISELDTESKIFLYLYPDMDKNLEQLAFETDFTVYRKFVAYRSNDYKSQEATESFKELLKIIREKKYGVDNILEDIINDDI